MRFRTQCLGIWGPWHSEYFKLKGVWELQSRKVTVTSSPSSLFFPQTSLKPPVGGTLLAPRGRSILVSEDKGTLQKRILTNSLDSAPNLQWSQTYPITLLWVSTLIKPGTEVAKVQNFPLWLSGKELACQGRRQLLIQEDPTYGGASEPVLTTAEAHTP